MVSALKLGQTESSEINLVNIPHRQTQFAWHAAELPVHLLTLSQVTHALHYTVVPSVVLSVAVRTSLLRVPGIVVQSLLVLPSRLTSSPTFNFLPAVRHLSV